MNAAAQNHINNPYSATVNGVQTGLAGCESAPNCSRSDRCLRANATLICRVSHMQPSGECSYFIPNGVEATRNKVLYSAAEETTTDGRGYWSITDCWTVLANATRFTESETQGYRLPQSLCQDRHWVTDPSQPPVGDEANHTLVLHSPKESATTGGFGYWNTHNGWTTRDRATRFTQLEAHHYPLPNSIGRDRHWITEAE